MPVELPMLSKATELAFNAHKNQFRKGTQIPYVNHLCEVTSRTAHYLFDLTEIRSEDLGGITKDEILSAAMLHDYIEDVDGEYSYVKSEFSENVAIIVQECSRDADQDTKLGKYQFLESFQRKSTASILIKIADRYCNVMDYYRTPEKREYASKYAMQAHPLYKEYHKRKLSFMNVMADLNQLSYIIRLNYIEYMFDENEDDYVKGVVL
jgi:(p)ppGpp synthase/HD superfamily hydrolase